MKWKGRETSNNVEDRRRIPAKGLVGGGIGTIVILLIVVLLGGNPSDVLNQLGTQDQGTGTSYVQTEQEKELSEFASVVFKETENVWTDLFKKENKNYEYPKLVLFKDSVDSACGSATSAVGPFYCPGDNKVYIDLSFCDELRDKFKAPGDFAIAYVIAHEVGHHVQFLDGTNNMVMSKQESMSETDLNKLLVRMELQADFYAGVWSYYVQRMNILEDGDLDEALTAATAVGDDRIQEEAYGKIIPDSFTHGTSEQRSRWFKKGFTTGNIKDGDTFSVNANAL